MMGSGLSTWVLGPRLGIPFRTSWTLCKHSTTELCSSPGSFFKMHFMPGVMMHAFIFAPPILQSSILSWCQNLAYSVVQVGIRWMFRKITMVNDPTDRTHSVPATSFPQAVLPGSQLLMVPISLDTIFLNVLPTYMWTHARFLRRCPMFSTNPGCSVQRLNLSPHSSCVGHIWW